MAKLCLLSADGTVAQEWDLNGRPLAVGRSGSVDVKIDDDGLSRRHFMIFREGEDFLLKDLNSRNGTWVDGARALSVILRHNSKIVAGRTAFQFRERIARGEPCREPVTGPHGTAVLPAAA